MLFGFLAVVWGGHWVVLKIAVDYLPPFTYSAWRMAAAIATLGALLAFRKQISLPSRSDLPVVFSIGLGQVAAVIALATVALQYLPAGRSATLVYTMPLWVAVLQAIAFRTPLARLELVGLVLGLSGIVVLLSPGSINWSSIQSLSGVAMLVLSAVIWAATIVHARRHRWVGSTSGLMFWELLIAFVPLTFVAILVESGARGRWQVETFALILYSGPLATTLGFWASQSIQRALPPMATAVGFLAIPVLGLIAGAIVLSEPVTGIDLIGVVLTMAGVATISFVGSPGGPAGTRAIPDAGNRSLVEAE